MRVTSQVSRFQRRKTLIYTRKPKPKACRRMTLKKIRSLSNLMTWIQQNPKTATALMTGGYIAVELARAQQDYNQAIKDKRKNDYVASVFWDIQLGTSIKKEVDIFKKNKAQFEPLYKKLLPHLQGLHEQKKTRASAFRLQALKYIKDHESARHQVHEYLINEDKLVPLMPEDCISDMLFSHKIQRYWDETSSRYMLLNLI